MRIQKSTRGSNFNPRLLFGGIGAFVLIGLPVASVRIVSPGFTGVVTSFGHVEPKPLSSGLNFVAPWKKVVQQDVRVRIFDDEHECASADMQAFRVRFILNYRRIPEKTPDLFSRVGVSDEQLQNNVLSPAVRNSLKSVMGRYRLSELSEKRPEAMDAIRKEITIWIEPYHIELLEISLADIQFSEMYQTAVEVKQVEEQRAGKAKYELDRSAMMAKINAVKAQGEADAQAEEAHGEAEALKLRAQAEAEAVKIEAEAQAEAYRAVAAAYRPNLLLRDQVEAWNGHPTAVAIGMEGILPFRVKIPELTDWSDSLPTLSTTDAVSTDATPAENAATETGESSETAPAAPELPLEIARAIESVTEASSPEGAGGDESGNHSR